MNLARPGPSHSSSAGPQRASDLRRYRTRNPDEAQQVVTDSYIPHRLRFEAKPSLNMDLVCAQFGQLTTGLLSYGSPIEVLADDTPEVLLNITLRGRASSRSGTDDDLVTGSGQGVTHRIDEPLRVSGSPDWRLLCLMAPKAALEERLEHTLGRTPVGPLQFDRMLSEEMLRVAWPALQLMTEQLQHPSGLASHPTIARHLEGLVFDTLLISQPHNYLEALQREASPGPRSTIARAAELIQEQPGEPWTVVGLAQAVHLSVRALQYGFRRDYDTTPMGYLREVRLRRVHSALLAASPSATTVRAIALSVGFTHMGRFADTYRSRYGEVPSVTLTRAADPIEGLPARRLPDDLSANSGV